MKKSVFLFLAFATLQASAQQTKVIQDANAKQRIISANFNEVRVSKGVELYLTQGTETFLAVSVSDEKYTDRFKTVVENGVLKIYMETKGLSWLRDKNRKLKAYLSIKSLEKLTASSGANVIAADPLNVNAFMMKFSSGSRFNGAIRATDLQVDQSSGSEINISGSALNFTVDVSSGAHFKGYDLAVEKCIAKVSSGAHANVTISNSLDAYARSGGKIQYRGNASVKNLDVNSGGSVKKG